MSSGFLGISIYVGRIFIHVLFILGFFHWDGFTWGGVNPETPSLNTSTVIAHVFCKDLFNNLLTVFQTDKGACSILLPSQQV